MADQECSRSPKLARAASVFASADLHHRYYRRAACDVSLRIQRCQSRQYRTALDRHAQLSQCPSVSGTSYSAIDWKRILDSLYSVINRVLIRMHLVNPFMPPMWLGEPSLATISVILVHTWRLPFSTVILPAGLTAIPKDIPKAAAVDGAEFWRTTLGKRIVEMLKTLGLSRILLTGASKKTQVKAPYSVAPDYASDSFVRTPSTR